MFAKIVQKRNLQHRILLLLLILCAFWGVFLLSGTSHASINTLSSPVRLHIIANSDQPFDQLLKLDIRDRVVAYLTPLLAKAQDREEAAAIVQDHIPALEQIALDCTEQVGYGAKAYFGRFSFPDRQYGKLFFPAGEYDALRLVLGEGKGHNWWCVLFPPLCFMDGATKVSSTTVPTFSGNTTHASGIKVKFKLAGSAENTD